MSRPEYLRSDPQKRRSKVEYMVIAILVAALFAGSFVWRAVHHERPIREGQTRLLQLPVAPVGPTSPAAQTDVQPRVARAP